MAIKYTTPIEYQAGYQNLIKKYIESSITNEEANQLAYHAQQMPWVQDLMIYTSSAIFIADLARAKYVYVSPSTINLYGYEATVFKDVGSLSRIADPEELKILPKITSKALELFQICIQNNYDPHRLRFTRNNWYVRSDGKRINVLQKSMALHVNNHGMIDMEFIFSTDITSYNPSADHFYRFTYEDETGNEVKLYEGIIETGNEITTSREREVFTQLTLGKTAEEAAVALGISPETVKTHVKNLQHKTNSKDRIGLLRYGYAQGWM